jgi:Flp pilus assembly protein TadD
MRAPFALLSLFAGGPRELAEYGDGTARQTDDRMALEFSGPRAINSSATAENTATLRRLLAGDGRPPAIARALKDAGAREWRDRGAMMLAAGAYEPAYQDYATASRLDRTDEDAVSGLVRAAVASHHESDAAGFLGSLAANDPSASAPRIALSKLHAATGAFDEAVRAAEEASLIKPIDPAALEQLASIYADRGDAAGLDPIAGTLQRLFPDRPMTPYYAAASNFLHERLPSALDFARHAVDRDPRRAAARNLLGAIHASLGQERDARDAFRAALGLDARDSTTYVNLGMLELSSGNRSAAAGLFAEALSLDPESAAARQGLARSQ